MPRRLAVIDLGTNTFHLLIISISPGQSKWTELYRQQVFVKLAADGIGAIGEAPWHRGLETMQRFAEIMQQWQVHDYKAIGTAALRTARNGPDFLDTVKVLTGIAITLIDGNEEARLIHSGVMAYQDYQHLPGKSLIMDIGGGSVEFILSHQGQVCWAASFPVGVAVLHRNFHREEPIVAAEVAALEIFLKKSLAPLWEILQQDPAARLIGASGTFDVVETALNIPKDGIQTGVTLFDFMDSITRLDREARQVHPQIPPQRVDMIVVALILLTTVLQESGIPHLHVCGYALKEGVLSEMIQSPS